METSFGSHNGSCCPGNDTVNLFTIGSTLDPATSIASSSAALITSSSSSSSTLSSILSATIPMTTSLPSAPPGSYPTVVESGHSAAIAIEIAVPLAIILLALLIYFSYRRRLSEGEKKSRTSVPLYTPPTSNPETNLKGHFIELDTQWTHEMSSYSDQPVQELPLHAQPQQRPVYGL